MTRLSVVLFSLAAFSLCGCQTHNYTQRGTTLGGLTGGGVGAVIGEIAADEPLVGAAIGSAVGALTGATVGSGLDEIDARHDARMQQALYSQTANGASLQEILAMSDSGLSDQIINRHIRDHGFSGNLGASDLIRLRQQGVSDGVIGTLQETSSRPIQLAQAQTVIERSPQVIVEERYHAVPFPVGAPWRRRGGPACPPYARHPGLHWGVAFGH